MKERLQKLLSASGVCSRRQGEEYILSGRVTVNGQVAQLGDKADPEKDTVALDGVPLRPVERHTYLMLHKPTGYVTSLSDDRGRKTVADLVADCGARVWPVGRLDYDSEGLLLLTDDGGLTHRLTHPSHEIEKEYHVTVSGDVASALPILRGRLELDGHILAPAKVEVLAPQRLQITIHQGLNRQVRRMCTLAVLEVTRLVRVREGSLLLGNLPRGTWRRLTVAEVDNLRRAR